MYIYFETQKKYDLNLEGHILFIFFLFFNDPLYYITINFCYTKLYVWTYLFVHTHHVTI